MRAWLGRSSSSHIRDPRTEIWNQIPQPRPLESITASETVIVLVSPVIQSPSDSISTLFDFTLADVSDDGNAEVLCGNAFFHVHISILSFHSLALRRMFAQTSLASAGSPNGCPRIRYSGIATHFAMLCETIYLTAYIAFSLGDGLFCCQSVNLQIP